MEIKTKFNVNDKLYVIGVNKKEERCKICNGTGTVLIKKKIFTCPECNGKGREFTKQHWEIYMSETYPEKINIEIEEGQKPKISYVFMWSDIPEYIDEKDCFATKEQAQKECDRRNGKTN
jgi:RecJ-like exonuclease